jgi:hypothetical protein
MRVEAGIIVRFNAVEADPFQEQRGRNFFFTLSSDSNKHFCKEYDIRIREKI